MAPRYIIVWDLDGTIGVFDAIEHAENPDEPVTVTLRPGIEAALTRLTAEGFAHVVLTMAGRAYADLALRATGLRGHFVEVSCALERFKGDAEGIAQAHGIPDDEMPDRMIFVGDHPWNDAPRDHRIVFHIEPVAVRRRAEPLVNLILELRRSGNGSIRRGFDVLAARRGPGERAAALDLPDIGPVLLGPRKDDCPVIMFASDPDEQETGTPITFTLAALDKARG